MYLLEVLKRWVTSTSYFYHLCWAFVLTVLAWVISVLITGKPGWEVILPGLIFVAFKEAWDAKWGKQPDWFDHIPDAFSYLVGILAACIAMDLLPR
jgi:hypothetical protein